jgi:hypothetical protein
MPLRSIPPTDLSSCGSVTVLDVESEELQRIRDLIDELREMREGSSADLYGRYSGAISSLRHILRMHGKDYEPG